MLVFLNGKFVPEADAVVPVNDRGFLLGDGLFETMRVAHGRAFRLAQHLDRLARGAEYFRIKLPFTLKEIQKSATELIGKNGLTDAVLRVTLTRGPARAVILLKPHARRGRRATTRKLVSPPWS